ncbi:MAG: tRNA dihydrouridine synthase DusB [Hyphomicrobiales bacterium]|nr:tRNA dihydrouridine synthase DusB [Hyphomicrobiales bacterium]OQW82808.1 MAG: tRNA dihydrouridine synthase DusB [Proteobacteria bacterium ST_bin15]
MVRLSDTELKIGGIALAGRVLLAPMAGVTDAPFRKLAMRFGASAVVAEMVASGEMLQQTTAVRRKISAGGAGIKIIQLAGCDAASLAGAARLAEGEGADIIDINMGCPAKRVINGWAGAALMREPDQALRLLEAVIAAVAIPVTVKMRLGWDDASRNAPLIARRAAEAGAAALTVHGRTRAQFYQGQADWLAVGAVKAAVSVPVIVNGDISDVESARNALALSNADGVMIGRAAIGQPWLLGNIARQLAGREGAGVQPTADEIRLIMRAHYDDSLAHHGTVLGGRIVRKHLAAYVNRLFHRDDIAGDVRQRLLSADDPAGVQQAIDDLFDSPPQRRAA